MKNNNIAILLVYFLGYIFVFPPILVFISMALGLDTATLAVPSFLQFIYYFGILALIVYLFKSVFIKEKLTKSLGKFLKKDILPVVLLMYGLNFVVSILLALLQIQGTSDNQQTVDMTFQLMPVVTTFTVLVFAPIVEEVVFRGVIYSSIRQKSSFLVASLVSSILFALLHFSGSMTDIPYLLVYGTLGWIMCYSYNKSKTIYAPIAVHFINNFIAILMMAFM